MAHSWWLLNITANNGSANVAIGDIEMHSAVGGPDLCTGGAADASSHLVGYEPTKAFDNTASTFWVAAAATGALRYQFPAPINVVELVITSRGDGYTGDAPKDFSLQYSDNGADWVDSGIAVTGATGWGIGESRTYTLPTPPAPEGWVLATLYKKIDGVFTEVSFADRTTGVLGELYVRGAVENWTDITGPEWWDTTTGTDGKVYAYTYNYSAPDGIYTDGYWDGAAWVGTDTSRSILPNVKGYKDCFYLNGPSYDGAAAYARYMAGNWWWKRLRFQKIRATIEASQPAWVEFDTGVNDAADSGDYITTGTYTMDVKWMGLAFDTDLANAYISLKDAALPEGYLRTTKIEILPGPVWVDVTDTKHWTVASGGHYTGVWVGTAGTYPCSVDLRVTEWPSPTPDWATTYPTFYAWWKDVRFTQIRVTFTATGPVELEITTPNDDLFTSWTHDLVSGQAYPLNGSSVYGADENGWPIREADPWNNNLFEFHMGVLSGTLTVSKIELLVGGDVLEAPADFTYDDGTTIVYDDGTPVEAS